MRAVPLFLLATACSAAPVEEATLSATPESAPGSETPAATAEAPSCLGLGDPMCDAEPDHGSDSSVLGQALTTCSADPVTGYYRTGRCETGPDDRGVHVVCAAVTDAFLEASREQGNDLVTPRPEYGFQGLENGDRWCLCAARWAEAVDLGVAPPVVLAATHRRALDFIPRDVLERHARAGD